MPPVDRVVGWTDVSQGGGNGGEVRVAVPLLARILELEDFKIFEVFEVDAPRAVEGQDDLDVGEKTLGLVLDSTPQGWPSDTREIVATLRPTRFQC